MAKQPKALKKTEPIPKSTPTSDYPVETVTYKVGPMPLLPQLPPTPYPYIETLSIYRRHG